MDCDSDSDPDADMLDLDSPSCTPLSQRSSLTAASEKVIDFIDRAFDHVYTELDKAQSEDVYVEIERVRSRVGKSQGSKVKIKERISRYHWPGDTAEEAWNFTCVLAILLEVKTAIMSGVVVTKRDIYYRQPELFKNQSVVDKWVDDIAFTCKVSRRDLMVTGSQKGLICGLSDSERVQSVSQDFENLRHQDVQHIRWVLVVEKEASFNTLVEIGFDQSLILGQGLLVTAKGYPDLQTRFFLRHILDVTSSIRNVKLFGLFDSDPDGLGIYRCYHSGSQNLAHETACLLPEMQWLGIDICECLDKPEIMKHAVMLTSRDRGRARVMLEWLGQSKEGSQEDQIGRMLRTMLVFGLKMEIQGFEKIEGGIRRWLEVSMAS